MARPVTRPVAIYATRTVNIPGADVDTDVTTLSTAINDPLTYQNYAVDAGAANAYSVTFSPAVTAYTAGLWLQFKSANANTGSSTINANGLGAKTIVNIDGSTLNASQIPANAIISVQYDGTNFQLQSPTPQTGAGVAIVRQTLLTGSVDSSGYNNSLSAGAGLNFNLAATATPLCITYAAGFGGNGNTDFVTRLTADASNQGSLAASNTNFITSTFLSSGSVTWGSTLAPPQYGYAYDRTKQSLLRFAGSDASTTILDDYGNTWTAVGNAQIDTAVQIDGLNTLLLDGTGDYTESTNINTLGSAGWTIEAKVRFNTLPTAGNTMGLFGPSNASDFGGQAGLNNTGGVYKLFINLSSTGSSNDITAATGGSSLGTVVSTTYHYALVYDALAGKYFTYVNGVLDQTVTSALKICGLTRFRYGRSGAGGANVDHNGAMAGCRFLPYCAYPNGTTFTAPTISTFTVNSTSSSDWFDISGYKMYGPTVASASAGTNPTLTAKNVVYHGEQDTNASAVTATRNYAYQGKYVSADTTIPGTGTKTSFSHNIGTLLVRDDPYIRCYTADAGNVAGTVQPALAGQSATASVRPDVIVDRNTISLTTGGSAGGFPSFNPANGSINTLTTTSWKMFLVASRIF